MPTWMLGSGLLVFGYLAYSAMTGDDTPAKAAPKKAVAAKKKSADDIYLPEDPVIRFASFTETPKDSFHPLYGKNSGGPAQLHGIQGEPNWGYTGYVVLNGKVQALLENSSTGEGEYVSSGEQWKGNKIGKITPDTLTMSGDTGPQTIKIGDTSELPGKQNVVANAGQLPSISPVNPLAGAIGNGGPAFNTQIQIDPGQNIAIDGSQPAIGFPARGGRRGGRGGGRGGRGGGGGNFGGN